MHLLKSNWRQFIGNMSIKVLKLIPKADWEGLIIDKRSTSRYCTYVWDDLVTWRSQKQNMDRPAETEFRAMANVVCEIIWLKRILEELRRPVTMPMRLYRDDKAAINVANSLVQHDRTKQVGAKQKFH